MAPTILVSLKIEKSKKNLPYLKTLLWKTPQPRHQTLLETLLTLTNAHVAEEIDRRFLLTCGQSHHLFGCLSCPLRCPWGVLPGAWPQPTSLMGIDVVKMVTLQQRIYISSHFPVSDRSSGPDMG